MNAQANALVVDDEPDLCDLLCMSLQRLGITADIAYGVSEAIQRLDSKQYQLCLTDLKMPDGDGFDVIRHIQSHHPHTPVAMMTAHGDIESATRAMKIGAFDFVSKPANLTLLKQLTEQALKLPQTSGNRNTSNPPIVSDYQLDGKSAAMQKLKTRIPKYARSQAPVYIQGPSGAGKERVARNIHHLSSRATGPFIAVNCGAIPSELIESELFGHIKGSFTGAHKDKAGLFQAADGGSLFLDEIADLPLNMQVKLLRVIQEKKLRAVGSSQEQAIDVRIISAAHQDLHQLTQTQQFRDDLYYRLNVLTLEVPALIERRADVPGLIHTVLQRVAPDIGISKQAQQTLQNYSFPGNVRELENILQRAAALCDNRQIESEDLLLSDQTTVFNPANSDLESQLETLETQLIQNALMDTGGNKTKAAEKLGISFRTLRYKLSKRQKK